MTLNKWSGTLEEYLNLIKEGTIRYERAHERIYSAIRWALENKSSTSHLIGMERTIHKLIEQYFLPASRGYEMSKRMLVLIGPPGSGKSSFVRFIKKALENYSRTDQGAIFKIKDSPLNENPLLALPEDERIKLIKERNIHIEGFLSPLSEFKLLNDYDGNWRKIEVERFFIDESKRIGIGTFFPLDPYVQEITDLIGSSDYSKITTYGSPSDPRAYRYDGEFQVANQGLLELHELFKNEPRLLYPFLTLTEEKMYKISRQQMIYSDQVVIAHSNVADYEQFSKSKNKALLSRMQLIRFPYPLKLDDEVKIYESKLNHEDRKIFSAFSLEAVAAASILSRLKRTKEPITLLEKMDIYNSEDELAKEKLLADNSNEGMTGINPRIIFDFLSIIASKGQLIDGISLLNKLRNMLKEDLRIEQQEYDDYEYAIHLAERFYYQNWETVISQVMTNLFKTEIEQLAQAYIDQLNDRTELVSQINDELGIDETNNDIYYETLNDFLNSANRKKLIFDDLPQEFINALSKFVIKDKLNEIRSLNCMEEWINTVFMDELVKTELKLIKNDTKLLKKILKQFLSEKSR